MAKIVFKTKERKMLEEIIKKNHLTVYDLSSKFQVEPITIKRWLSGENIPKYSTRIMIARMYQEYKEGKWTIGTAI